MRALLGLLLAGFLILVGAYPALAAILGSIVALAFNGALVLLAEPGVFWALLIGGGLAVAVRRLA